MRTLSRWALVVLGSLACGCSTEAKKDLAKSAVNAMTDEQRHDAFEATIRMLDEEPHRVDEFYAIVRRHEPTMRRFIENTSRDLRDPSLAKMTAEEIAQHGDSVEQMMIASIDAIAKQPEGRKGMNRAMAARARTALDIVTDDRAALARMTRASLDVLRDKPVARQNVIAVMKEERAPIVAFVKNEQEFSKTLARNLLRDSIKNESALGALLQSLGVFREEPHQEGGAKAKH